MKVSRIAHVLSGVAGVIGVLTLLGGFGSPWGNGGMYYGMMGMMRYGVGTMMGGGSSSISFFLIAIWLQLAASYHMKLEQKGEQI